MCPHRDVQSLLLERPAGEASVCRDCGELSVSGRVVALCGPPLGHAHARRLLEAAIRGHA